MISQKNGILYNTWGERCGSIVPAGTETDAAMHPHREC